MNGEEELGVGAELSFKHLCDLYNFYNGRVVGSMTHFIDEETRTEKN